MRRIYWHNMRKLPVTFHLDGIGDQRYWWSRVVGVRIGNWFIGAIQGAEQPVQAPPEAER